MFNVLIVEDDKNTKKLMDVILTKEGFNTFLANDGLEALSLLETKHIDIILLDVMMPNMDGFEFTKILRDSKLNIPIIMTTAKSTIIDKKEGFTSGADDYMVKPVDDQELILRINALLRRAQIINKKTISVGDVSLNYDNLTVTKNNEDILLPKKEFYLLFKLLSFPNVIFTKHQLFNEIWGLDSETTDHTVTVHINRLRNKFKDFKEFEIITIRNLGYKAVLKT